MSLRGSTTSPGSTSAKPCRLEAAQMPGIRAGVVPGKKTGVMRVDTLEEAIIDAVNSVDYGPLPAHTS